MDETHGFHRGLEHWAMVRGSVDVLHKDVFDAFLAECQTGVELITAAERGLEVELHTCHDSVDALLMKLGETDSLRKQEFMTGVFCVVLIVGIVDNALKVTLIVAHLHAESI